ncbi:MAG: tol-pal system protein YbgF [Pseudomonadota bacterium]
MITHSDENKKSWGAQGLKTLCLFAVLGIFIQSPILSNTVQAQSNDVLNRLNRLENELDTLNRAVYRGEMPQASARSQVPPVYNTVTGNSAGIVNGEVRLQELETQLRELTGKIEEQRFENDQLKRKIDRLESTLNKQEAASVSDKKAVFATPQTAINATNPGMSVLKPSQTTGINIAKPRSAETNAANQIAIPQNQVQTTESVLGGGKTEPTIQYEQAFADLKAENYVAAQQGFESFLANYENHSLASNAKYWLGESFYARSQFEQAAKTFAEGYRSFPESQKAPDNLLKLGLSLAGMDKKDDACVALGQLPIKHPDGAGPILRRGEQERERLGCNS